MTVSIYESFPDSSTAIVSEKNSEGKGEHLVDPQEGAAGQRRPVFLRRDHVGAFLSIVLSGQLVYAAFEALKAPSCCRSPAYWGSASTASAP